MRFKFILIVVSLFQVAVADIAPAPITTGDVLVLDIGIGGDVGPEIVFRVDPITGSRTIFRNLRDLDTGDRLRETNGIAVERSGNILLIDSRFGSDDVPALYRLDTATGNRTLLTVFNFASPDGKRRAYRTIDLAVEESGSVLVLVGTRELRSLRGDGRPPIDYLEGPSILYRVDPVSGEPTPLTDFAELSGRDPQAHPTTVGAAVALAPSGTPVVVLRNPQRNDIQSLYRLNPSDGSPTLITTVPIDPDRSPYPPVIDDIEVETSGAILAVASQAGPNGNGKLYRINQRTGAFSVLTDFGAGPFETLGFSPVDIALEASGNILVADSDASVPSFNEQGSVWRINPRSGARSVLSDFGQGANQGLNPYAVAVVPPKSVSFDELRVPVLDIDLRPGHKHDWFDLEADITLGDKSAASVHSKSSLRYA